MHAIDTGVARSPLAETAQRLSGLNDYFTLTIGVPSGDRWSPLAALAGPAALRDWHAEQAARCGDRRAAAMDVGGAIVSAVVEAYLLPALAEVRLPLAGLDELWAHRHDDGWIDAVAIASEAIAVLPGDPALAERDREVVKVVADRSALLAAAAQRLSEVEALLEVVAHNLPVGMVTLWGALADSVGSNALWLARLRDGDRRQAWADAQEVIDRLGEARRLRVRPRPFPVVYHAGEELYQVRGTCCLWYRTVTGADPDGEGYCSTCPLRTDTSRTRRLRTHLEPEAS